MKSTQEINTLENEDKGLFVRFKVSEEKITYFKNVFSSKSEHSFNSSLFGTSKDSGSFILTFLFKVDENNSMKDISVLMYTLSCLFHNLAEYYPSFAEKPSNMQQLTAKSLITLIDRNEKAIESTKNKTQKQLRDEENTLPLRKNVVKTLQNH